MSEDLAGRHHPELDGKFCCAACACIRDLEDLPRATLVISAETTGHAWTQLVCWPCVKLIVAHLHRNYCPQDCEEEHEVR